MTAKHSEGGSRIGTRTFRGRQQGPTMSLSPAPARPKARVTLRPGFSQMDWMRLANSKSGRGVAGSEGTSLQAITFEELRLHNRLGGDAWMALHGKVYNVTQYAPYHPGGVPQLLRGVGNDASALFDEVHPWVSESMLSKAQVGVLVDSEHAVGGASQQSATTEPGGIMSRIAARKSPAKGKGVLTLRGNWKHAEFIHIKVDQVCKHCFSIRLRCDSLSDIEMERLLQPGVTVKLRANIGGKLIERPFTCKLNGTGPGTVSHAQDRRDRDIDLFVKLYEDGVMTALLAKGPNKKTRLQLELLESPLKLERRDESFVFTISGALGFRKAQGVPIKHICMIAQGTGIMPMIQILDYIISKHNEFVATPTVSLLMINRSDDEIPFKLELENLRSSKGMILKKVEHLLSSKGAKVTKEALSAHLEDVSTAQPSDADSDPALQILSCGSFEFNETCENAVSKLGLSSKYFFRLD